MKIKIVTIGIKSAEQGLLEFGHAVESARRGKPAKRRKGVYFTSLEAMRGVLTPKRIEILHLIRERVPASIYELARLAERDLKNVQDDVALLARLDLVSLRRSKTARASLIPRVDYQRLQLQIPI